MILLASLFAAATVAAATVIVAVSASASAQNQNMRILYPLSSLPYRGGRGPSLDSDERFLRILSIYCQVKSKSIQ